MEAWLTILIAESCARQGGVVAEQEGLRLLVAGGGTGGHLFPGIAVAEKFLEQIPNSMVTFVSTGRAIDKKVLADRQFQVEKITAYGLKGKSFGDRVRALTALPMAFFSAMGIIRRFRPHIVLGVGGYITGPVLVAAWFLGVPGCIHEQNSVPGLTNRLLGRFVRRIFLSLPGAAAYFPCGRTVMTGNPVRDELVHSGAAHSKEESHPTLLVLGGSQGAHRVNELVTGAIKEIKSQLPGGFRVIHQAGAQDEQAVRAEYAEMGVAADVTAFITDMATAYRQATLIVSRAGATTVAEIAVCGKPAVFIPYPFAADDHQRKNAEYFVENGAAKMYDQVTLTPEKLGEEIVCLFKNGGVRMGMAAKVLQLAVPDAAENIIAQCRLLAGREKSPASCVPMGIL